MIVDAATGVTGAGRALEHTSLFCTVDEDFTAYGLLDHRHTPEIEQEIGAQVLFTPHLAPMSRGILATCYARPTGAVHDRRAARRAVATSLRRRAVRGRDGRLAVDQGDARLERRAHHRPLRRAHRHGHRDLRASTTSPRARRAARSSRPTSRSASTRPPACDVGLVP